MSGLYVIRVVSGISLCRRLTFKPYIEFIGNIPEVVLVSPVVAVFLPRKPVHTATPCFVLSYFVGESVA